MKNKIYFPMKNTHLPMTISYFSNSLGIGIGYGDGKNHDRFRAQGESLERFWHKYGPSNNISVYSIRGENEIESISFTKININNIYNIDTSGLAFHSSRKESLYSALLEFCERQSLIVHWKYGTNAQGISTMNLTSIPYNLQSGEVTLREISIFPGVYVVLALYSSQSRVMYAAGASADFNLSAAVQKALRECSQGYLLMEDNLHRKNLGKNLMDNIQINYLNSNNPKTVLKWPVPNNSINSINGTTDGSFNTLSKFLMKQNNPLYVLFDNIFLSGRKYYICRFFSDSWFLGLMDTSRNDFLLYDNIEISRNITTPVPFG